MKNQLKNPKTLAGKKVLIWDCHPSTFLSLVQFYTDCGAHLLCLVNSDMPSICVRIARNLGAHVEITESAINLDGSVASDFFVDAFRKWILFRKFVGGRIFDLYVVGVFRPGVHFFIALIYRPLICVSHSVPVGEKHRIWGRLFGVLLNLTGSLTVTLSNYNRIEVSKKWFGKRKSKKVKRVAFPLPLQFATEVGRKSNLPTSKNELSMVASLYPWKRPVDFLLVARELQSVLKDKALIFNLIGDGDLRPEVLKVQKALDLGHCLRLIRKVNYLDLVKTLGNSRIYIQTSEFEGFCFAVLEALSLGIPCVVSNQGALKELVTDGFNGFVVEMGNIDEYTKKCSDLLTDDALWLRMSSNAQLSARRHTFDRFREDFKGAHSPFFD
jgi:glycosyltransferase involved in cell wall biosynthesis